MSKFGTKVDANQAVAVAGHNVKGNTLLSLEPSTDRDGNTIQGRWTLLVQQKNPDGSPGAKVYNTFFEPSVDWQFDRLNENMIHLCTKIVPEPTYEEEIINKDLTTFDEFMRAVSNLIFPAAEGKEFTMKFVYNKGKYFGIPERPNWITPSGVDESLLVAKPKEFYTPVEATAAPATTAASSDIF